MPQAHFRRTQVICMALVETLSRAVCLLYHLHCATWPATTFLFQEISWHSSALWQHSTFPMSWAALIGCKYQLQFHIPANIFLSAKMGFMHVTLSQSLACCQLNSDVAARRSRDWGACRQCGVCESVIYVRVLWKTNVYFSAHILKNIHA